MINNEHLRVFITVKTVSLSTRENVRSHLTMRNSPPSNTYPKDSAIFREGIFSTWHTQSASLFSLRTACVAADAVIMPYPFTLYSGRENTCIEQVFAKFPWLGL